VRDQIAVLDVRNQSNVSRLIKSVQDGAYQIRANLPDKIPDEAKSDNYIAAHAKLADLSSKNFFNLVDVVHLWMKVGDFSRAHKTADLVLDASDKKRVQQEIAAAQAKAAISTSPNSPGPSKVSEWLEKLTDDNASNDCPLNTAPFRDLAGYLKTLPANDHPQDVFKSLRETAETIVAAQDVVHQMLKAQLGK
jgi:hypothetical protein